MVFYNGKVITADERFSIAEAVAVRDGKFLAAGDSRRILAMAGPATRKVDLQGRSLIPGMIATHQHGYIGNSSKAGVRLRARDVKGLLAEMKATVDKLPAGKHAYFSAPSIVELMCHNEKFDQQQCVSLAQLDAIAPNTPLAVVMQNNQVVVNSQMLKLVPHDLSGVLKDAQGRPTGQLRGGAGGVVAYEIMPWHEDWSTKSVDEERENMKQWPPRGITTLMGRSQGQAISILRELWVKGELNTRVRFAHEFLRQNPRPEIFLKRVGNLTGLGDDWFKIIGTTTQAADGTAYAEDFKRIKVADHDSYGLKGNFKWSETGDLATSDRQNIILANRYGWSLMGYHTAGDGANDEMLKVFAEAHKERPLNGRHFGLDHNEMLRKEHIDLFKTMGVNVNLRGSSFSGDNSEYVDEFGADSVHNMGLVKTLIDAGLKPAIEIGEGMASIQAFLLRKSEDGRVWNPAEKVTRQEALWMYTLWAAAYSGEQSKLGSIEPGKLADLVVLGGDYMSWPEEDLANLSVLMTVVGGKVVHEVPGELGTQTVQ
jgi:predicted amidohydrolase YtcJ